MPNTDIEELLEQKLLNDKSFQHVLKFAPESQRELMTFELAKYFNDIIQQKVIEARIDEVTMVSRLWSVENSCSANNYSTNAYLTDRLAQLNHNKKGDSNDN